MLRERLALYLNQSISWIHFTAAPTFDIYGQPSNRQTTTIACRILRKNRIARDEKGREIVSTSTVLTQALPVPNDMLDGKKVLEVRDWTDRDGSVVGKEALLE